MFKGLFWGWLEKSCLVDNIWNWQDVQTNDSWTLVIWCRCCSRSIIKSIQPKVREALYELFFLPGCSIRSKRAAIQDLQNVRIIWPGVLRWWCWWSWWPARTTGWQAEQGEQQKVGNLKKSSLNNFFSAFSGKCSQVEFYESRHFVLPFLR